MSENEFIPIGSRAINLISKQFGRWTVLGPITRTKLGVIKWLCQCTCGNVATVSGGNLRQGISKSCGCLRNNVTSDRNRTHNLSSDPLYQTWAGIIGRCTNPSNNAYKNYGGRSIKICDEWRHDFAAFHAFIIKLEHYGEDGYTIDRILTDGNYEPGNIKLSTRAEQARHTRQNRMITYKGETKCLADWAKSTGISVAVLRTRLKFNWTLERLFDPKVRESNRNKLIAYNGREQNLTSWSKELHIGMTTLQRRLSHGWSVERSFETPVDSHHRRKSS